MALCACVWLCRAASGYVVQRLVFLALLSVGGPDDDDEQQTLLRGHNEKIASVSE